MKPIVFGILKAGLGLGLLTYLWFSGAIHAEGLGGLLTAWPLTLMAFLLMLLGLILTGWRLSLLMKPCGFHLSTWNSIRLTYIGTFFNVCLPGATGGDAVRIYYATGQNQGRRMEVATIILFDRLVGLFGLLILPLLAMFVFGHATFSIDVTRELLLGATLLASAMIIGVGLSFSERIRRVTLGWLVSRKFPGGEYLERIFETVGRYREKRGILLACVLLSLVIHTMTIIVILLVVQAIHSNDFAWEIGILIPFGMLANALPLTPGGLGVGEAAFDVLFNLAGLAGGAEAILGWRLLMILSGLIGLTFYFQRHPRYVHSAEVPRGGHELALKSYAAFRQP